MNVQMRVRVQWLPTRSLRMMRQLKMGEKWGSEVQQTPIVLTENPELFGRALPLATQMPGGDFVLLVGWEGSSNYNNGRWQLSGKPGPRPGLDEIRFFAETPTKQTLIETAWTEAAADPDLDVDTLRSSAAEMAEQFVTEIREYNASIRIAERERVERESNPLFDEETFYKIAHWAPQPAAGDAERPPGTMDRVAVPELADLDLTDTPLPPLD